MAAKYEKNIWELYDPSIPKDQQVNSFITKRKLDKIEQGIEQASIDLEVGDVNVGDNYGISIVEDTENQTKKLNVTFPNCGADGKSAYDIWVSKEENAGKSEDEFLASMKGEQGQRGLSAFEVWQMIPGNENKTVNEFFEFLKGEPGKDGEDGQDGSAELEFVDF